VNQFVGDEILALFGISTAHGDDARRAVRAAVGLHERARESIRELERSANLDLSMHTGIATGLVLATVRDERDGRVGVTGDTVNLAARLRSLADANEICVDKETQRQASSEYVFEALPAAEVKGKSRPVACYRLVGVAPRTGVRATSFVGRQRELRDCSAIIESCLETGTGRALYVRGEAGIGKTRLLEEVQRRAAERGFVCHTGLVLDFGSGTGRDAIRTLAQSLLGLHPNSSLEARSAAANQALAARHATEQSLPFLNDLLDIPQTGNAQSAYDAMSAETRQRGIRNTVSEIVRAASKERPLLLAVEDLHWADGTTLTHLASLTASIAELPALIVMTSRTEGDPIGDASWRGSAGVTPVDTVDLESLPREDALALAEAYVDTTTPAAQACIERAGGNAFFLEQLLQHLQEIGAEGVPGSVQSSVLARLDRLPAVDKRALQAASILGQRFTLEALRHLTGGADYDCAGPIRHQLVRREGRGFLFSHALIQEGIYRSLLRSRALGLHLKAAGWFMDRDPALRAQHLDRAQHPDAAHAYLDAAKAQIGAYRHEQALSSIARAVEIATTEDDRCDAQQLEGEVLHDLGSIPESIACCEKALAHANNVARRCRARIGIAAGLRMRDQPHEAFRVLKEAEEEAREAGLSGELSRLHHLRGNLHFPLGNLDACLEEHEKALDYARKASSAESEARALGGLADAYYIRGRMKTANEYFRRCVELSREHGFGRIEVANYNMVGYSLFYLDHREIKSVLEIGVEAAGIAARVNDSRSRLLSVGLIGCVKAEALLDMSGVDASLDETMEIVRRIRARRFEALVGLCRGLVTWRRGDAGRSIEILEEALGIGRETGLGFVGPWVLGHLARATPDPSRSQRYLEEGEGLIAKGCVGHNYWGFYRDAIDVSLRDCNWSEAERYAAALEDLSRPEPWPRCEFVVRQARTLAAYGRGGRDPRLLAEIAAMREECRSLGLWAASLEGVFENANRRSLE
jgi:tetratricopeptide (TPR) repeat protein